MTEQPTSELEQLRDEQGRPLTDQERIERLRAKVAYLEKQRADTVHAHVERTVHALLDAIEESLPDAIDPGARDGTLTPDGIKILAEAVQALSSWRLGYGLALETAR